MRMTDHRVRWVYDEDPDLSYLEQWDTPAKYKEAPYMHRGEPVPFTCYINTYGNPDNYEVMGCILEERCDHCGQWDSVGSLWGIDFYSPDKTQEIPLTGDPYELDTSGLWDGSYGTLSGYAKEVADDLMMERRFELEHV